MVRSRDGGEVVDRAEDLLQMLRLHDSLTEAQ